MKSTLPKVLHPIGGRTLLGHALHAARQAGPQHLSVVVRHERERVAAHVAEVDPGALIADQYPRPPDQASRVTSTVTVCPSLRGPENSPLNGGTSP